MAVYLISKQRCLKFAHYVATLILVVTAVREGSSSASLSHDYYWQTCPQVERIVAQALIPIFIADPRSPAAFLRLLFHDCQVQGCDASILLDHEDGEMDSSKNFGIRNRDSIGFVKSLLETECPGVVSCADIIAMSAREAVAYSGGPRIAIPFGRKDGGGASRRRADEELPSSNVGVDGALKIFLAKGMSVEESVAILGAHTIGVGHCINIVRRLYGAAKENMDFGFELMLRLKCPNRVPISNDTFIFNDLSALLFDNQYYKDIASGRGLFAVDADVSVDARTAPVVRRFAEDPAHFFRAFSMAFVKLSSVGGQGGGEIRRVCNQVN